MVGTEVLVVGIVVPLIVGPVSIFFKSLWDKYSNSQEEKRKNYYESRLNELKNKIDLFYWPVYIKLKCLYSGFPKYGLMYILPSISPSEET